MNNMSSTPRINPDCHQTEQLTQIRLRSSCWLGALTGFSLLLFFAGCETTVSTRLPQESVAQIPVTLSPGDVVKITFPGAPDFNQTQKIQADGRINLPMVGQVDAAGRTIASLQQKLEALYQPQLQNANVVVTLDTSVIPVVVAGAVSKPGKYFFDRPTTILQAVMEAGGPDQFGTLGKVTVIRLIHGQQRSEVMDLRPILRGQSTKAVYVRAGDVIVIGEGRF
jgi:polysaccharide export outer membrane protein